MRVTGVITCHNYGDLVVNAIRSFRGQDYDPMRLIVIDDGSSDRSWEAITTLAADSSRPFDTLRVETPRGVSFARNLAIARTWDDTDAFAFLDADDEYRPGKVARSVGLLRRAYGKVGLVYTDERAVDSVRGVEYDRFKPAYSLERLLASDFIGGNFVVARSAFEDAGRFDESLPVSEGYDLALRIASRHVLLHIPEPLVIARLTHRSLRSRVGPSEWDRANQKARREKI